MATRPTKPKLCRRVVIGRRARRFLTSLSTRGPPDSSLRPAETGDSTDSIFPGAEITPATSEHALEHASQRGLVTPNAPSSSWCLHLFGALSNFVMGGSCPCHSRFPQLSSRNKSSQRPELHCSARDEPGSCCGRWYLPRRGYARHHVRARVALNPRWSPGRRALARANRRRGLTRALNRRRARRR